MAFRFLIGYATGMESRIERACIERGLKMTGQRRVIARVLSDASDHPDVEDLYRRAVAIDPRISIATVYRTVRLLEEKNILARRDFGGGRARYEASEHGVHYHLIDVDSGRVLEFASPEHEELIRGIADTLGFALVSMRLEVFAARKPGVRGAAAAVSSGVPSGVTSSGSGAAGHALAGGATATNMSSAAGAPADKSGVHEAGITLP